MGRRLSNPSILVLLLIVGGLIGSLLGVFLGQYIPVLGKEIFSVGLQTTTLDLAVFTLTFGLLLKLNVASVLGFIISLIFYFR